jgi:hypothetical protein
MPEPTNDDVALRLMGVRADITAIRAAFNHLAIVEDALLIDLVRDAKWALEDLLRRIDDGEI